MASRIQELKDQGYFHPKYSVLAPFPHDPKWGNNKQCDNYMLFTASLVALLRSAEHYEASIECESYLMRYIFESRRYHPADRTVYQWSRFPLDTWPTTHHELISHDELQAIATIEPAWCLLIGDANLGFYDNVDWMKANFRAWQYRFPYFRPWIKFCAGKGFGFFGSMLYAFQLLQTSKDKEGVSGQHFFTFQVLYASERKPNWFIRRAMRKFCARLEAFHNDKTLKTLYAKYFGEGHPIAAIASEVTWDSIRSKLSS